MEELPGWLGKTIEVPPGRQGILLDAAGKAKLLPAGKTVILSHLERMQSNGVGLLAGYLPAEPFELRPVMKICCAGMRNCWMPAFFCALKSSIRPCFSPPL
ncbi:MAG: hypothetical protein AB9891_12915 [Anaerolineaceae bacterium]